MIVKPTKQDLVWSQPEKVVDSLSFLAETVQLRVKLDIDLAEQSPSNDLPNQAEDQVLSSLLDVSRADIDN